MSNDALRELAACPFCGGRATQNSDQDGRKERCYWVDCTVCLVSGPIKRSRQESFDVWNTRALASRMPAGGGEVEVGKPVAWLKRGGRVFVDGAYISHAHAERAAMNDPASEVVGLVLQSDYAAAIARAEQAERELRKVAAIAVEMREAVDAIQAPYEWIAPSSVYFWADAIDAAIHEAGNSSDALKPADSSNGLNDAGKGNGGGA